MIAVGEDPAALRRARQRIPTFGQLADEYIEARKDTVRSAKSVDRWRRALGDRGYSHRLRSIPVDRITTEDVMSVLRPMWNSHPSSAGLLRGYIEAVLNSAKVAGHRHGDNPATWSGHLQLLLPPRQRLTRGHHAALPFGDIPAFFARLRAEKPLSARALEFTILTAARTSETLNATWDEIDLEGKVWTIPAARMKAGRDHRVPLSDAVVRLMGEPLRPQAFLFPGRSGARPLSGMAMEMVLRRMSVSVTVHGFRSTFRDWAGETTATPREVAEAALAHAVGDAAEQAYRRGDALEKRRGLMAAWSRFCLSSCDA